MAAHVAGWPVDDPQLAEDPAKQARQLIDEYRVSLFAQHIRTTVPVSQRRVQKFVAGLSP